MIAAISSPQDRRLKADGFTILGDAAEEIGAYQGSAYAVRRSWAKANEKEVLASLPQKFKDMGVDAAISCMAC